MTLVLEFGIRNDPRALWAADARCGVVTTEPDGRQSLVTQRQSGRFQDASTEATRHLTATLPNGLAFARDGDFLIANFGTNCPAPGAWPVGIAFDIARCPAFRLTVLSG